VSLHRKSFVLLLILLFLMFIPSIVELLGGLSPSPTFTQAIGFALTLIGIFGGAYFELDRFERQRKEERQKEIRQHRSIILQSIENWTDEVARAIEDIGALRELSPKDERDDKLIVSRDKITPIAEKLLRLDYQWLTIMARAADVAGSKKDETRWGELREEQQSLIKDVFFIGTSIRETREALAKGNVLPGISHYAEWITEAKRAIDKLKLTYE